MRESKNFFIFLVILLFGISVHTNGDVARQHDLAVTGLKVVKKSVFPGHTVKIHFTVVNNKEPVGPFKVAGYFSNQESTAGLDPSQRIFLFSIPGMRGNKTSLPKVRSHKVPLNSPPGRYYMVVVVDADNQITETTEYNNKKSTSVNVKRLTPGISNRGQSATVPTPDIILQRIYVDNVVEREMLSVSVKLKIQIVGNVQVRNLGYSIILREGNKDRWGRSLGGTKGTLPGVFTANSATWSTVTFSTYSIRDGVTYTVYGQLDPDNLIIEPDENNNYKNKVHTRRRL